jgi:hypothetical protein
MTEMALRSRLMEREDMDGRDNGLTLQSLANRLETLERENAALRDEVAALSGSETSRAVEPVFEGRVSRRALLSKAGAAAVAAMAAGTLLNPREARADHSTDTVQANQAFLHFIQVLAWTVGVRAVEAFNTADGQGAIHAENSGLGAGVRALGGTGVWGSSATTGRSGVYGEHKGTTGFGVIGDGKDSGAGVLGRNSSGTGVWGEGSTQAEVAGVRGIGKTGVWGSSATTGYSGVYGQHTGTSGIGVVGDGKGGSAGVLGRNPNATGVRGEGVIGVWGQSSSTGQAGIRGEGRTGVSGVGSDDQQAGVKGEGPTGVWGLSNKTSYSGVYGEHTGTSGIGTVGIGKGGAPGVLGRNDTGVGVLGEGTNGVHGKASGGYGGQFEGGRAQLRLVPAGTVGKPTSGTHQKGEIYMDSAGALFVCTATSTATTTAKWRKVTTTAV